MLFFEIFLILVLISALVGFLSGSYPSFILSRINSIMILKRGTQKFKYRIIKPLVILQFTLSAFMYLISVIMTQQINYITKKDPGYDKEKIIVIPTFTGWSDEGEKLVEKFRNALISDHNFINICGTGGTFYYGHGLE